MEAHEDFNRRFERFADRVLGSRGGRRRRTA